MTLLGFQFWLGMASVATFRPGPACLLAGRSARDRGRRHKARSLRLRALPGEQGTQGGMQQAQACPHGSA